jgi:CRISPR-associated protein Cmr3
MNTEYRFIEPLDVLYLRGNKLFGDPGSYGESLIPPWPSVAAGAIRSRMLADEKIDLSAFGKGESPHPTLGTPQQPGSFAVIAFHLARRRGNKGDGAEILVQPPADLVIAGTDGKPIISVLTPQKLAADLLTSANLPLLPVLAQGNERSKPASGYWLKQTGWHKYLNGELPAGDDLVKSASLWKIDPRIGIGLQNETRSAADGRLFSAQAVALQPDIGFVAAVQGAMPPAQGLLRFGGDGRAATITPATITLPEPDYAAIAKAGHCRITLTTPGLFSEGWKLPGTDTDNQIAFPGIQARLVSAAIHRAEIISGWDLAQWQPKPAQRVAPTGSVYWLDELQATPEALRKLVETGLWGQPCEDTARRAEGFNRFAIATWK